jgi:uncharacterized protein (AIM24 family)
MEKIFSLNLNNNINISTIDNKILQILLKTNDKIIVNSKYITYASSSNLTENIYNDENNFINKLLKKTKKSKSEKLEKITNSLFLELKNKNDNFEYLGLSKGGKIIKILPILYNNLFINIENILAFNFNIDLFNDEKLNEKISKFFGKKLIFLRQDNFNVRFINPNLSSFIKNKQFVLVKLNIPLLNNINLNEEDELNNENLLEIKSYLNDFIYISGSENSIIEKRLGNNEQIIINKEGLIAFEKSVNFYEIDDNLNNNNNNNKISYLNNEQNILIEGPGLIIFETSTNLNTIQIIPNKKNFILPFIFLIVELIFTFLIVSIFGMRLN